MNALQHMDLLSRTDRVLSLRAALQMTVRPGTHVLDAGCGAGILSMWSAMAGAERVVAVDLEGIDLARALAQENGVSDRIHFVTGDLWDHAVLADEGPFDVIAAMIYLNDPRRDERQSELAYQLRDRYLTPGGSMIPDRVRYAACAYDWPTQDHATRLHGIRSRIAGLEGQYGLRLNALAEGVTATPWKSFFPTKHTNGTLALDRARALSDRIAFCEVDYRCAEASYPRRFQIEIASPGLINTVVWTQELWFADLLLFSNDSVSWIANPTYVEAGLRCTLCMDPSWRNSNILRVSM